MSSGYRIKNDTISIQQSVSSLCDKNFHLNTQPCNFPPFLYGCPGRASFPESKPTKAHTITNQQSLLLVILRNMTDLQFCLHWIPCGKKYDNF